MKVIVKESLANGRLTQANRDNEDVLYPAVARIRELAESRGTIVETVALAGAFARPWVKIVLTGAATVDQIRSIVAAIAFDYDTELDEQLRSVAVASDEYWRARSSFTWN
jgi:aryl-alcohol dehydrogenase-like predicted oxidoreductase